MEDGTIKTSMLTFENIISNEEVVLLRGCIASLVRGWPDDNAQSLAGKSVLFHNHKRDALRYSYPLIQYKRMQGCAAVVGINEGAEALVRLAATADSLPCRLGQRSVVLKAKSFVAAEQRISLLDRDARQSYRINRWLPLNSDNYRRYQHTDSIAARVTMLERILTGNILSMAKCVGVFFEGRVRCTLTGMRPSEQTCYKGVELMAFSADFGCNVDLPENIGLGKAASVGYGTITKRQNHGHDRQD